MENEDFFAPVDRLSFADGSSVGYINITLIDDDVMEAAESFRVSLLSVQGGALIGGRTTSRIVIAKSDYPNGRFLFAGPYTRSLVNPDTAYNVELTVRRVDGKEGDQLLFWRVRGPNSQDVLTSISDVAVTDDLESQTTSGELAWPAGMNEDQRLVVTIKPHSGWEVEKSFAFEIYSVRNDKDPLDDGEIDIQYSVVMLVVQKNGEPNGVIQFSAGSSGQMFEEPQVGYQELRLFIERLSGNLGDQEIYWQLIDGSDDFNSSSGSVVMSSGVSAVPIILALAADDVPEFDESFELRIQRVVGGASVKSDANSAVLTVKYNDNPHGVFELLPASHNVTVDPVTFQRSIHCTVVRRAGLAGPVRLLLEININNQSDSLLTLSHSITFQDGQSEYVVTSSIADIFLPHMSLFTATISSISYAGSGEAVSAPSIGASDSVTLYIPEIALNSVLKLATQVTPADEQTRLAEIIVTRDGVYGNVQVAWSSGLPSLPSTDGPIVFGPLAPPSGLIYLTHGTRTVSLSVTLGADPIDGPAVFAAHLTSIPVSSISSSRSRLGSPSEIVTEFEPHGVVGFSSPHVTVREESAAVTLSVTRQFGSRGDIHITYSTLALSASPTDDFEGVQSQPLVMREWQREAKLTIAIYANPSAELTESFLVTLDDVRLVQADTQLGVASPRISGAIPNCTVTIEANDDPYGLIDIVASTARVVEGEVNRVSLSVLHFSSAFVYTTLNLSQVRLTVRRNAGTFGRVSVRVRTVGGGEPWDYEISSVQRSSSNNTISEAMANRDSWQISETGTDYVVSDMLSLCPGK